MRVLFIERYGAYYPGADPNLDKDEATRLIALGVCKPYEEPAAPAPEPVAEEVVVEELDKTDIEQPTQTLRSRRRR